MTVKSEFGAVLEATERLSVEEREVLVEVLRLRGLEDRRVQIKREIAEANAEFVRGKCKPMTPGQIMRDLLK